MSSMYRDESPARAPSMVGDGGAATASGAVEREDNAGVILKGRVRNLPDKRRYRYDAVRGRGAALPFTVTRDAIMSAEEAGDKLHEIHVKMGIDKENEDLLSAFDSALFFCHTVNGASTLVPGRSKFSISGKTNPFDYGEVRDMLGVDMRRFFRAYADDITDVNRRILRDYDPADPVAEEQWGWLQDVAHARGLIRFPHLAHDSADACLKLSPVERQALQASKQITIGATPNAADRMRPNGAIASADRYDSSVGENY